jgi:hypothetical protein
MPKAMGGKKDPTLVKKINYDFGGTIDSNK